MGRKTLQHQINSVFIEQAKHIGDNRDQLKHERGGSAVYDAITSPVSLQTHKNQSKQFVRWLKTSGRGVKNIRDITGQDVDDYIKYRASKVSIKTVESDVLMLNHLSTAGDWGLRYKSDFGLVNREQDTKGNRQQTGAEWIIKHKTAYENHKLPIDTLRGFGLRRSELLGATTATGISKKGLTTNSFVRFSDGGLGCVNVAKGGHLYVSRCRDDLKQEMEAAYGKYAVSGGRAEKIIKKVRQKKQDSKTIAEVRSYLSKGQKLYQVNDLYHNIPSHVFRSEFAVERLNELKQENKGATMTVAGFVAPVKAFRELSEELGHHRISVLYKYLR